MSEYSNRMLRSTTSGTAQFAGQTTGVIAYWNSSKGFGFIRRDDHQPDVFCHINEVADDVDQIPIGQRVKFQIGTSTRNNKPEARDVRLID